MDDAQTLLDVRQAEDYAKAHKPVLLKAHPTACVWCYAFRPASQECEVHGGKVPHDFIPKGCDAFEDLIPF